MKSEWLEFVKSRGARLEDGVVVGFDSAPEAGAEGEAWIADLSHLAYLSVCGEQAHAFLQGQLTNDLDELSPQRSQLSAWCSAKGRVLVVFRIVKRAENDFLLQLPAARVEAIVQRLRLFVLRAKVELADLSDALGSIGIVGAETAAELTGVVGGLPAAPDDVAFGDEGFLVKLSQAPDRYQLSAPHRLLREAWDALSPTAAARGRDAWALAEIRAGLASIYEETADQYLPQMLNLGKAGGISFDKGCYVGQEVIARAHYRGQVKRTLHRLRLEALAAPQREQDIVSASSNAAVGKVIDAAPSPHGGYELLGVINAESARSEELRLGDARGPVLRVEAL